MANIVIVSESKSFMVTSLISQLEEQGHKVTHTSYSLSEIVKIKNEIKLMLIYAEEMEMSSLVYLKDKVIEEDFPIFVLGDINQLEEIKEVIPPQYIKMHFMRPINVKDVVNAVDRYMCADEIQPKKKILVVDDSGAMLRTVKEWLQDRYQVILANSGAMAIKCLTVNRPDLILLDYEMPICDGSQVLEMIRAESDFADIPVIFLTGKNDRDSVIKVSALKPEGYLLKSMEAEKIIKAIDDFFEKRKWII